MDETSQTKPVVDPRYIINVLIELQVVIRKLGFYSFSHTIVPSLLEKLEKQFNAVFQFVEVVSFGITRHELLCFGNTISTGNPVIAELARSLNGFGLAGMTFSKGLTKGDLLKCLRVLIEGRTQTPEKKEQMAAQLQQESSSVRLRFIRFGEALRNAPAKPDPAAERRTENEGKELWRGLVRQLAEENPEARSLVEGNDSENPGDLAHLAEMVNRLCQGQGGRAKSYEGTIVKYLNKQAHNLVLTDDKGISFSRELSKMLSNLAPDVRDKILRISVEETLNGEAPIENLLEFLPESTLMEVLNHIQLSGKNISGSMLSLLSKFTELSAQNKPLEELLQSKLRNREDLYQELLTNRSNRAYYPSSYRSLLDQELTLQQTLQQGNPNPEIAAIEPVAVNHHLALVLLEVLEGPTRSQPEYGTLIRQMDRLLTEGMGERTHAVLQETLMLLFQKLGSVDPESRLYLQKEIKSCIKPEILSRLLQSSHSEKEESVESLLGEMRQLAGADIIPMLLDLLETEENLSARKRLLEWILQCGPDVIPLAVKRLQNPKWYVVRNMLVLLKDLRAKEALPHIAQCLKGNSPKLKMAALQAVDALGKGTDSFYEVLSAALEDRDPGVFRKAVSMAIANQDPRAMGMITSKLGDGSHLKSDGPLLTVLGTIRKAGVMELIPELIKLRRRLRLRFWHWNRTRNLVKALDETVRELQDRERKDV